MRSAGIQRNRNTHAFTVIEVLVASAILLVALLAIMSIFPTSSTNVDEGGRISTSVALAQQNLEYIKNSSFATVLALVNCPVEAPTPYTCAIPPPTITGGASPYRLATVTVTVNWQNSQRFGNIRLVTAIAE